MGAGPPPLTLVYRSGGEEHAFVLAGREPVTAGRGIENRLILPDSSVSRRHAELRPGDDGWTVVDLGSTNGVAVNGRATTAAPFAAGDRLRLGSVDVEVRAAPAGWAAAEEDDDGEADLLNATIVRRLEDLPPGYLAGGTVPDAGGAAHPGKRAQLDAAYSNEVFRYLTRLAGELLRTDARDQVLSRVLDVAFEALPVDRGYVFLRAAGPEEGELVCELAREGDEVAVRPPPEAVPVSRTMLRAVVERGVALVTPEAAFDQRLAGAESVRLHGLRSALAAPLWSGERIVGALVLDTPSRAGSFTEQDLELATALANFAAVAIERIRHADRADHERRLRARLERYHSPGVVGEVLSGAEGGCGEGLGRMKRAEVSVLFADLVGFTPLAESAEPEEVAALLGEYFTGAVEAIFAEGGTLDKFIGDGVMAFFGAPVAQPDHAARAVRAAQAIQASLGRWNAERAAAGRRPLAVRVAVNSGPVVVGEVGSEQRVDYTVLGNTVNVAARLEESVAGPGEVVVSAATLERLEAGAVGGVEELGEVTLKGLRQRVVAYRLR